MSSRGPKNADVRVFVRRGRQRKLALQGSGSVIGPRHVLTAHHVVNEAKEVEVSIAGGERLPATVCPPDDDTDVAVLHVESDIAVPPIRLRPRAVAQNTGFVAWGYPEVGTRDKVSDKHWGPEGTIPGVDFGNQEMQLNLHMGTQVWRGISGAGVLVDGALVGVVTRAERGWGGRVLVAANLAHFYNRPWFRAARAPTARDAALDRLQNALATWVRGQTGARRMAVEAVLVAVDRALGCGASPEAVVGALVRADAEQVFRALSLALGRSSERSPERRSVVGGLLRPLLPLLVPWDEVVGRARMALEDGADHIDIELGRNSVAEVVLSGAVCLTSLSDWLDMDSAAVVSIVDVDDVISEVQQQPMSVGGGPDVRREAAVAHLAAQFLWDGDPEDAGRRRTFVEAKLAFLRNEVFLEDRRLYVLRVRAHQDWDAARQGEPIEHLPLLFLNASGEALVRDTGLSNLLQTRVSQSP